MSEENMSDSYEVGYGKPPRNTQFQKGISGNPKGRPKKTLDFHHELLRESRSSVIINENGKRRRVSKHKLVIKQLIHKAVSGNVPALRAYLGHYQIAFEKVALLEASKSSDSGKYKDLNALTDEQLLEMIFAAPKDKEQETKK
jgi:Family of unknown function (DUF5681)